MRKAVTEKNCFLLLCIFLCGILLTGCGPQECSFCGQKRFCKEFDLLGTTRYICEDCLHDPSIAVSGNVAREYSALYEDGTLEYPENSPLREQPLVMEPEEEATGPSLDEIMNSPSAIPGTVPEGGSTSAASQPAQQNSDPEPSGSETASATDPSESTSSAPAGDTTQPAGDTTQPAEDTHPAQDSSASQEQPSGGDTMVAEDLIRDLNRRFQADGYRIAQDNDNENAYRMLSGNNDLHIRLTPRSSGSNGKYELTVSRLSEASSSDYVKCVIRCILSYADSEDYDGLGHEIYNNTIQNGSYSDSGVSYSYTEHTADEIERGSTDADFVIRP